MKHIIIMLKPASSLCNMRCSYCFYTDVSSHRIAGNCGLMNYGLSKAVIDNVFSSLRGAGHVTFAFQGGEPTLAGLPFFEDFCAYARQNCNKLNVGFSIQTNGIGISEDWCDLFKRYGFLVGLSLDGPAEFHNANRRCADGAGTYRLVMDSKKLLVKYKIEHNILIVLTNQSARSPQKIWNFIVRESIAFVQFIPCLGYLNNENQSPTALEPQRLCSFYITLFSLWSRTLEQGKYISIKFFDDLINQYLFDTKTACGIDGKCGLQYVIEADGTAYPCDFYALDEWCMGNLSSEPPEVLAASDSALRFLKTSHNDKPLPPCLHCRYQNKCGGGCRRMRNNYIDKHGICHYKKLLEQILEPLLMRYRQPLKTDASYGF